MSISMPMVELSLVIAVTVALVQLSVMSMFTLLNYLFMDGKFPWSLGWIFVLIGWLLYFL